MIEVVFQHKYQRYKDGSNALWTMGVLNAELEGSGHEKPSYYLSPTQMQMMQILQQNQVRLFLHRKRKDSKIIVVKYGQTVDTIPFMFIL